MFDQCSLQTILVLSFATTTLARFDGVLPVCDLHLLLATPLARACFFSLSRCVGVIRLHVEATRLLHVLIGSDWVATVASSILRVTGDDLLWRKLRWKLIGGHVDRGLDGLCGRGCPATAALTLVFDGGCRALGAPIQ